MAADAGTRAKPATPAGAWRGWLGRAAAGIARLRRRHAPDPGTRVHLYTICWNEADILGFFFRHYDPWVERYVVYDDGSDDGSAELLAAHPRVELRRFPRTVSDSFVLSHQTLQNEVWRESRGLADWVVVTAIDEHLELPGAASQRAYLAECHRAGVTAVPAIGYQMIADRLPGPEQRLASALTRGAPWGMMNKLSVFDPERLDGTEFAVGRHTARMRGKVCLPAEDRLMLLHYKYVDFERTLARQRALGARLGSRDRANRWGNQYDFDAERLRADWDAYLARAVDVAAPGFRPDAPGNFEGPIWWRKAASASAE